MTPDAGTDANAYLDMVRRQDRYLALLGVEVVSAEPGRAVTRIEVRDEHRNFFGVAHGGLVFSLADTAFGVAANAHGRLAAMIDAHITMTEGVLPGDVLTASAEEVSSSRRIGVYRATVTRSRNGEERTVATFTGTVYRTDRQLDLQAQGPG